MARRQDDRQVVMNLFTLQSFIEFGSGEHLEI